MFGSTGSGAGVKGRPALCSSFKIHFVKLRSAPTGFGFVPVERETGSG